MGFLVGTANSKLFIGGVMAGGELTESDFESQSSNWEEIKGTTNLGRSGDTSTLVTSDQIAQARTRKLKGTRNAGSMELVCDLDLDDEGQVALLAAEASSNSYAFRMVFNDAPADGTPSERLFVAFVMSAQEQYEEANSIIKLNSTLEIDSNIVRIAAAEDT